MNALKIIGVTVLGAIIGGGIGAMIGSHEDAGSDLPIGWALFGGMGIIYGGAAGVIIGAVAFA